MKQILDKMRQMRLPGMARAYQLTMEGEKNQSFTVDEMLIHLIDAEWDERYNRRLAVL